MRSFPLRLRGLIVLGGILGLLVFGSAAVLAVTISRGKTSQRGLVRVYVMNPRTVTGLTIELQTRCTDPYDIVGRDVGTGVRFRQRASFTAQLTGDTLRGSARVTQTFLATSVVRKSQRVTFSVGL